MWFTRIGTVFITTTNDDTMDCCIACQICLSPERLITDKDRKKQKQKKKVQRTTILSIVQQ